tara:strand:+ start:445 stop:642 length:198 start_codon:yes stop_codon:yes gene_type:complete
MTHGLVKIISAFNSSVVKFTSFKSSISFEITLLDFKINKMLWRLIKLYVLNNEIYNLSGLKTKVI